MYAARLLTERGTCFDETDKCSQFAAEGRCYSRDEPDSHHSNYCLRSCGMCGMFRRKSKLI